MKIFCTLVHGIIKLHFSPTLTKYFPLSPCITTMHSFALHIPFLPLANGIICLLLGYISPPFWLLMTTQPKQVRWIAKNKKLVLNWKVRNYLACSDEISMLILKASGIWLVHRTKCFRLDSNCETMACGQCKTIVWFEPYEQRKFLYLSPWDHQIALLPHID